MRAVVIWLFLAVAIAEVVDEPWLEQEDIDEPYEEEDEDFHFRRRREVHVEDPYEEHIRVKRCCEESRRARRSANYVRVPRQVHQYEVHEFTEEAEPSSPPYEEMLAAASDHYHRVYASPGASKSARYLNPDASPVNMASLNQPVYVAASKSARYLNPDASPVNMASLNQPVYVAQPASYLSKLSSQSPVPYAQASTVFVPPVASVPAEIPIPAASVPLVPLQQLDGDQSVAAGHHHQKHHHGHVQGGGQGKQAKHYAEHGGKTSKGFNNDHYVDKGGKGHKTDELHRKEYEEAAGKKKKHHDHAGHKGSHEEQAHGQRGAHFDEKKGHKKGHKTKGYHNKYHKDEFHKEHKFYDDYHKSGEHHRFGKFNAKHASNESGKKKAHHVNAGHDFVERGKKGYSNKGHVDADHKGYNGKEGHEEHHQHHSEHGKKGGKEGGSHWGHSKKN